MLTNNSSDLGLEKVRLLLSYLYYGSLKLTVPTKRNESAEIEIESSKLMPRN